MEEKEKVCCLIGQRSEEFLWNYKGKNLIEHRQYRLETSILLEEFIEKGYNYFLCGCERGADMDMAEEILYYRTKLHRDIKLEIVLRYPKQAEEYDEREKRRYEKILSKADKVTVMSKRDCKYGLEKKKRYLVDKAEMAFVVWNVKREGETYGILRYAERKRKEVEFYCLWDCLREYKEVRRMIDLYGEKNKQSKLGK